MMIMTHKDLGTICIYILWIKSSFRSMLCAYIRDKKIVVFSCGVFKIILVSKHDAFVSQYIKWR